MIVFSKRVVRLAAIVSMVGLLASGAVVKKIAVLSESENSGYNPEALSQRVYHIIRTRIDGVFDKKVLNDDIKELMLSGSFDNVRVEQVDLGGDEIGLNIFVMPKPLIQKVEFRGNKEYSEKKLLNTIEDHITVGQPLEERKKAAARKAILEKYQNDGYYGTEVTTLEEKPADGQGSVLVFVIKEETRHKLEGTRFENATVFEESDLRTTIVTQRQWWRYIFRFGNYFNKQLLPMDKDALKKKYHNAGYLDFEVTDVKMTYDEDNYWVTVNYLLQEGKPYTVTAISIVGASKLPVKDLEAELTTKTGMVFSAERERLDTSILKSKYGSLGYLDIQVWATHEKNEEDHTVGVVYHIREGNVIRINDIKITGNDTTRDDVIRRELAIQPGDLGNPDLLETSKARLMALGYFSNVEIVPAVTNSDDVRDLRVRVEEKPTGNVSLGAAFSSEDSVLGQFEFSETNFDLERLLGLEWPPKGGGQRFRTRVQLGNNVTNLVVSLEEPWFLDRRLSLGTEFFLRNRFEDEYDQRNIGAQFMLSWPIDIVLPGDIVLERGWMMGVGVRFEYVDISDCDVHADGDIDWSLVKGDFIRDRVIADEEGSNWANRLIWRIIRDKRDRYRFPTSGSISEFQAEYVTKALGSYEDYFRFNLGFSSYFQLPTEQILKVGLGGSVSTDDDKIGIFDRYFAGGIGTVRGFKRRDVAPVDRFGDPLGGNTMVTGTVELLQPIKDVMFASVFYDIGNVWYESCEFDSEYCMSVGFGVQFKALPVSLYYGIPIAESYDHLEGKSGRFHFNIGFTY